MRHRVIAVLMLAVLLAAAGLTAAVLAARYDPVHPRVTADHAPVRPGPGRSASLGGVWKAVPLTAPAMARCVFAYYAVPKEVDAAAAQRWPGSLEELLL